MLDAGLLATHVSGSEVGSVEWQHPVATAHGSVFSVAENLCRNQFLGPCFPTGNIFELFCC